MYSKYYSFKEYCTVGFDTMQSGKSLLKFRKNIPTPSTLDGNGTYFLQTTWRQIPEDSILKDIHRRTSNNRKERRHFKIYSRIRLHELKTHNTYYIYSIG
jgi:hypothetical protein